MLKKHFVVGWKNIWREDYVGNSHGYTTEQEAVGTTNGAGPRNMQTFVLSGDGRVLHCLPGFWHPADLAHELELARVLNRLWKDKRSLAQKKKMFSYLMLRSIREQSPAMVRRSGWQGFDAKNERDRLKMGKKRDTFFYDENGKAGRIKPTSRLMRERMAKRPFVKFSKFDTETYVDYGRPYYDNNARVSGSGVNFGGTKGYLESQKRMADRRKKRAAKKSKKRKAAAPTNKTCPVTGKPAVGGPVSVYKGKAVALCCRGCKKRFDKNPAKVPWRASRAPQGQVATRQAAYCYRSGPTRERHEAPEPVILPSSLSSTEARHR